MKCLSDGKPLAVERRSQTQEVSRPLRGNVTFRCTCSLNMIVELLWSCFWRWGYKQPITQICTCIYTFTQMRACMYQKTCTRTASSMKKSDDAWLLIIRLRMKIDWVPYETEKLLEHSVSLFGFSCFNWTTRSCHFVKWRPHRSSLLLQKWISGCFYSHCCLRAHCHQRNYQRFCCHHCCFYHHCYHCNYQCYHDYLCYFHHH